LDLPSLQQLLTGSDSSNIYATNYSITQRTCQVPITRQSRAGRARHFGLVTSPVHRRADGYIRHQKRTRHDGASQIKRG